MVLFLPELSQLAFALLSLTPPLGVIRYGQERGVGPHLHGSATYIDILFCYEPFCFMVVPFPSLNVLSPYIQ